MVAVPSYISSNARRGLDLLDFAGDGLRPATIREARALAAGDASEDKIKRMAAWFARHLVDLSSAGASEYLRGDSERPTPGQVAWLLWGGDIGQNRDRAMEWAERTRDRLEKAVSERVTTALEAKVETHNDKHGDSPSKRVNVRMLTAVFERGVGAYNTNPSSVRPGVGSSDQWAYARVNTFLQAVRTGRFPGGKFDTDLLPEGHPMSTRKDLGDETPTLEATTKEHISYPDGEAIPHALPEAYRPAEGQRRCDNCSYYKIGACLKFGAAVRAGYVCNAWKPILAQIDVEIESGYGYDDEEKGYGSEELRKEIVEEDGEFCVYSEGRGRRFGCYPSMGAAEERLAQIESFSRSLDSMTIGQLQAAHALIEKADDISPDLAAALDVVEDLLERSGFAPPYTTGDVEDKYAALHTMSPLVKAEERYTLGPVYVPGRLDGHGEFIDAPILQKAIWDWVRSGDRTIYLQHSEKSAGEMVEILTWPMPISTSLSLPGEEIRKVEFPPETPFMGVVWESWAWDLVKAGQLRGYSIGGRARRVEADLSLETTRE